MTAFTDTTAEVRRSARCMRCDEGRELRARQMCTRCYQRALKAGDFIPAPKRTLNERLDAGYVVDPETGCWLWQKRCTREGYGTLGVNNRPAFAHRLMYQRYQGAIPQGLQLDHLCRVRNCCNPSHLEPVTPRENTLRGLTLPAANAAKTHCPNGHPFAGSNLRLTRAGGRVCRTCDNRRRRVHKSLPVCKRCGLTVAPVRSGWHHVVNQVTSGTSCGRAPLIEQVAS